ncbi:ABC-2 family transporter protein [Thalassoglobus sp. JC818]|uniref:ABC transporter permease n=1 Tax=Thalassoglobus sp. JC818 TaxID=3232136 RepID=UPI00345925C9
MMSSESAIHPFARFRVSLMILRTAIAERLMYRADFAMGTLFRFLPIVTQIFLWGAIFSVGTQSETKSIAGYSYEEMIAYYLLAMLARAFSSMPGLASGIARQVRDGTIKKFLTQPIDLLGYLFWHRVAHKLVYYAVAAGPFALVFFLCRGFLPEWPGGWVFLAFLVSLVMGFLMGFLIESLLGLVSFWFLEVSSLLFIYMMFNYFLSGHMIPLDFLPEPILMWIEFIPFKYLAYVPAAILLDRYTGPELVQVLVIEVIWIVGLLILNRLAFSRGVKRYSAFGG